MQFLLFEECNKNVASESKKSQSVLCDCPPIFFFFFLTLSVFCSVLVGGELSDGGGC